jgi:FSR family fosmidomycin resistance protein-like MFS transporter
MVTHEQHRTRTLWLTGVLHAFTHVYQVALMPLYLLMQRDFNFASVSQATVLLTVMMAACFGPSYPIGVLADRMSRKKLLAFGLALNGLGFVALALAPNYAGALVAVAVAGFGGSFYHPAATAMVTRLFPGTTGKALGLVGIGAGVGFFVGPIYAGWRAGMLEPILGPAAWRRPVIELGILGIVVAAIFAWMADEERPASASERKKVPAGKLFPTAALWFFFLAYCFAFSVRDFAGSSMSSLSSLFLQKAHGYDPKWTGLALSGIFVAAIISNPLFGILSDGGRKRWIAFALVASALMVVIFPHVPSRWTIPVLVVYGFFFLATYPMTEAALMESVPDAVRGRVFGLFVMGGGVIGNLSHWAVGVKVKHLGEAAHSVNAYFASYLVVALLALASLLGLLCLPAIQRREGPVTHKAAGEDSMPLLT